MTLKDILTEAKNLDVQEQFSKTMTVLLFGNR